MAESAAIPDQGHSTLLVFHADGQRYALPHHSVQEIVRPMVLARAPLAPRPLLGLGNLRGAVLPVVDLAALMGSEARIDPGSGRVLVLSGASPVGLKVDQVDDLVRVGGADAGAFEAVTDATGTAKTVTLYHDKTAGTLRVLDVVSLVADTFPHLGEKAGRAAFSRRREAGSDDSGRAREVLIAVSAAGQEFALPIGCVLEVLAPDGDNHLTRAGAAVLSFRGRLLPRVSMCRLLGFTVAADDSVVTMVVRIGGADIALDVDQVNGIIRVAASEYEAMPGVIAGHGAEGRLQSVIKLEQGRRLVSLLSPDHLFPEDMMNRIRRDAAHRSHREDALPVAEQVFVVFRLDQQEYAIAIDAVQEVSRLPAQITPAPHAPAFLRGLSNLRGVVLPIVDQRARFGFPAGDTTACRLIVMSIGGKVTGFVVDAVIEVLRAPETSVMPSPLGLSSDQPLSGVISLQNGSRMILLLDPARLLSTTEAGLLGTLSKVEEAHPLSDQAPDRR